MRSANNFYSRRTDSGISFPEPSLAQQHYKESSDINNIVNKFLRTGVINVNNSPPLPSDFVEITTYQDAMQLIKRAEQSFSELPSSIRREFNDSPSAFVSALEDSKNIDRFRDLGVLVTPEPPAAQSSKEDLTKSDGTVIT